MQLDLRSKSFRLVLITVIITVIVTIAFLSLATWLGINIFVDHTIGSATNIIEETCLADDQSYRGEINFPRDLNTLRDEGALYDQKLATTLWDIGGAVASSNCKESMPLPPPFKDLWKAEAYNPDLIDINGPGKWTVYGYIFYDPDQRLACFMFAGTYYRSQWRKNLKVDMVSPLGLNGTTDSIKMHRGFYDNYMAVRQTLWSWWQEHGHRVDKLILAGRSLGGALSTICAYDFADVPGVEILHYSFASPRVGNPSFAQSFNQRIRNSVRVYNTEDLVGDVPPAIFRNHVYEHVGDPRNSKAFTRNLGSLIENHIEAYRDLPL